MANKKSTKSSAKAKSADKKNSLFGRGKAYIASVRSEMRRVVWPTKAELVNYSIAVCGSLIFVGAVIALLDLAVGQGMVLFAGLRG